MLSGENLGVNHRPLSTNFHLQLPDLIPTKKIGEGAEAKCDADVNRDALLRHVTVTRSGSDDKLFGLLIRRATKNGKPVLLVDDSPGSGKEPLLVPGDQLVAVGDIDVEEKDREEVVEFLTAAENQISLTVGQPVFSIDRRGFNGCPCSAVDSAVDF